MRLLIFIKLILHNCYVSLRHKTSRRGGNSLTEEEEQEVEQEEEQEVEQVGTVELANREYVTKTVVFYLYNNCIYHLSVPLPPS